MLSVVLVKRKIGLERKEECYQGPGLSVSLTMSYSSNVDDTQMDTTDHISFTKTSLLNKLSPSGRCRCDYPSSCRTLT